MTILELPEPELRTIRLDPYERATRGAGDTVAPQTGRLALGLPILQPLNAETVDEDTKPFLQARTGSRFHLLTIITSFTSDLDRPFVSAWVDIKLRSRDPNAPGQPIAWSMKPDSASEAVSVSRKVTLSRSLKLGIPGVPLKASVGGGSEQQETFIRHDVSMEALNEGRSDPRWAFYTTNSGQIHGKHTLCLVIDIPAGVHGTASIEMSATIRIPRMKIFKFSAALTEVEGMDTVQIPPS
jgi:hypothetical protein